MPDVTDELLLAETVGVALQVVLDRLTPQERVAFVMHDSFGWRESHMTSTRTQASVPRSLHDVPGGVVHPLPADLRQTLVDNSTALAAWQDITPIARNEFICWVEDAKQERTRQRRIRVAEDKLQRGERRPCCWAGCKHRERNGK